MSNLDLDEFAEDLRQQVVRRSNRDDDETTSLEAFVEVMIDELSSAGLVDDGTPAIYKSKGVEASGFSLADDDTELVLFVAVHKQTVPPTTTTSNEIETSIRRGISFIERIHTGLVNSIDESTPAFDMGLAIQQAIPDLRKIRIIVITDGIAVLKERPVLEWRTRTVSTDVWDVRRLYQLAISGRPQEPINIDFLDLVGSTVPCLPAPELHADYRAVLAIFPAQILVEAYDRFGGRLLERNVRAFLQARGKVNAGIRKTILEEPQRFLAYNNGISATASNVEIISTPGSGYGISKIEDLQIVNGGQTTASLHHLAKRDRERSKVDLSQIFVQVKISIVPSEHLDEIVPLISRYANSQNKINDADFEANSPYHVAIETLSRRVWAPAKPGSPRMTHWFYERARGQYADSIAREGTPARIREFKLINPSQQKFSKTDIAKFVSSWDQRPFEVSLGAEKNFRLFTLRNSKVKFSQPSHADFEELIAKAILYRETERIISESRAVGYRANAVTYTIALLSKLLLKKLDFTAIWEAQLLSLQLEDLIRSLSAEVRSVLINAPGNGNVTEWCKKPACWERVQEIPFEVPENLTRSKVPTVDESQDFSVAIYDLLESTGSGLTAESVARRLGISKHETKETLGLLVKLGQISKQGSGLDAIFLVVEQPD